MRQVLSTTARGAFAVAVFLLVLAVSRWLPVGAQVPWDVTAGRLFLPVVLLAAAAALSGAAGTTTAMRMRPVLVALGIGVAALGAVVVSRGPTGLSAQVSNPDGLIAQLPRSAIDIVGHDLASLPHVRKWTIGWSGPLRPPVTGAYRLRAEGRGRVEVRLDDHVVLTAEGERFREETEIALTAEPHPLAVTLTRTGPGPRLRLSWTRPGRDGRLGTFDEVIPPRYLGAPRPPALWWLTDALALWVALCAGMLAFALPWERPAAAIEPRRTTALQWTVVAAGLAALTVLMSWPLVLDLAGHGVVDRPDGRLQAWTLAWNAHALPGGVHRAFQAPIFHPLPDSLAFSENLLLPSVVVAPFTRAGGPVLGYNVFFLITTLVSGLGAYALARRATGDPTAAFVAGVFFALGTHRWIRMAHLNVESTLFIPLALLAFDRFWERRTVPRALVMGALLAAQGLCSIYLGAITATALLTASVMAWIGGLRRIETLRLAAGFLLAAIIMIPVMTPYFRMRSFQAREFDLDEVSAFAATPASYLASGSPLYGGLMQRHLDPGDVRDHLFPGLVPLFFGLAGLASAPRRFRLVAIAASVVAIFFSLGPETALYRFLHEHVVLVRAMRALGRFSLIPVLALSVLAGLAVAGRRVLAAVAVVLLVVESGQFPIRYAPYAGPSAAARWLAGKGGAVAYLPLGERDTEAMLDGIAHFRPLVNGDTGFVPRPYARMTELLQPPLSEDALRLLRAVGVAHVVTRVGDRLPEAARFGDEGIHDVPEGEAATVPSPAAPAPVLWRETDVTLDLGRVVEVGRVTFPLSDAPWRAEPGVSLSDDGVTWREVKAMASLADAAFSLVQDPRHGVGEVRFRRQLARFVRIPRTVPIGPGDVGAGP